MCESIAKLAKARSTKIAKDAVGETSSSSSARVDPSQYNMGGEPPNSSANVQEQATGSLGYRGSIGQDSAIGKLARARRPKVAQDADWDEGKHKRAGNGQFGSGGGGSAPKSASAKLLQGRKPSSAAATPAKSDGFVPPGFKQNVESGWNKQGYSHYETEKPVDSGTIDKHLSDKGYVKGFHGTASGNTVTHYNHPSGATAKAYGNKKGIHSMVQKSK